MKSTFLPFLFLWGCLFCITSIPSFAQPLPTGPNKTDAKSRRQGDWIIWYGATWEPTVDSSQAQYYRRISYIDDKPRGAFSDHYRNGNVQCSGKFISDQLEEIYDGLITWYREDGSKEQEEVYANGEPVGVPRLFARDGKPIAETCEELNTRGVEAAGRGELLLASSHFENAMLVASVYDGLESASYATTMNNLAGVLLDLGKLDEAERLYLEAKNIYEQTSGPSSEGYATALNNLGYFYQVAGTYTKAEPYFLQAKAIREKLLGKSHPDYASILNNLGSLYQDMGRYSKAGPLLEEALRLRSLSPGKESSAYATSLSNLGLYYVDLNAFAKAEPLLLSAKETKGRILGTHHPDYGTCLNNLAALFSKSGNFDIAERYYLEADDLFLKSGGAFSTGHASVLNNLAVLNKQQGKQEKAEKLYQECLSIRAKVLGKEHPVYINTINNLAELYRDLGNYSKAEPLYGEVVRTWQKKLGKDHPLYATALFNLGSLYSENRLYSKAEPLLQEALDTRKRTLGVEHPDYVSSLHSLAVLYDQQNSNTKAEALYREVVNNKIREIHRYFPSLSESEKEAFYRQNQIFIQNAEEFFVKRFSENPAVSADLYNLRLATKALLFNAVNKMRSNILASNDPALRESFLNWQDKKDFLARVFKMSLEEKTRNLINEQTLGDEVNNLEKELSKRSELFAQVNDGRPFTWEDVRHRLEVGEAAAEMIQTKSRANNKVSTEYVALIVKPSTKTSPEMVVLEQGDELNTRYIHFYRNTIRQQLADSESYNRYWEKISTALTGVSKIHFSADGVYHQLNLSTLFNKKTGKFLLDEIEVKVVHSTRDLAAGSKKEMGNIRDAVLFGYPDYNNTRLASTPALYADNGFTLTEIKSDTSQRFFDGSNITELPGTKTEVESIASMLSRKQVAVKSFSSAAATEDALKQIIDPQVLHIATHGFFLSDIPLRDESNKGFGGFGTEKLTANPLLRSGLLFAGVKSAFGESGKASPTNDGLLTAYEAMNLKLDNTNLVVLSACETGLGVVVNGEGVYGLQRAFSVAGARWILMSLWSVSDEATQELMTLFYENWLTGKSIPQAFRAAQIGLRSKYPHPFYWGAFVLSGM